MKNNHYIISLITVLLLMLWIPTGLDKFWDLEGFRQTLRSQPFPNSWAEVLYVALPIGELGCALLLVVGSMDNPKTNPLLKWGFALSTLLLLGFTLFILFGVLGWYEKRPCGCGSVISGLSWEQHLWFNVGFLLVSLWGWWLRRDVVSDSPEGLGGSDGPAGPGGSGHSVPSGAPDTDAVQSALRLLAFRRSCRLHYPRKFALFPGRPVGTHMIP